MAQYKSFFGVCALLILPFVCVCIAAAVSFEEAREAVFDMQNIIRSASVRSQGVVSQGSYISGTLSEGLLRSHARATEAQTVAKEFAQGLSAANPFILKIDNAAARIVEDTKGISEGVKKAEERGKELKMKIEDLHVRMYKFEEENLVEGKDDYTDEKNVAGAMRLEGERLTKEVNELNEFYQLAINKSKKMTQAATEAVVAVFQVQIVVSADRAKKSYKQAEVAVKRSKYRKERSDQHISRIAEYIAQNLENVTSKIKEQVRIAEEAVQSLSERLFSALSVLETANKSNTLLNKLVSNVHVLNDTHFAQSNATESAKHASEIAEATKTLLTLTESIPISEEQVKSIRQEISMAFGIMDLDAETVDPVFTDSEDEGKDSNENSTNGSFGDRKNDKTENTDISVVTPLFAYAFITLLTLIYNIC